MLTLSDQFQYLRRTIYPYVGQIAILLLVTFFVLFISVNTHVYKLLFSVPVIWLLFAPFMYFGLKYKIYWNDNELCQKASGQHDVYIKYSEITRIASEVSNPGELLSAARPFRRIAIYAGSVQDEGKFIDVSLKHFAVGDVRRLMRRVHERRPDLALPKHWP